MKGFDGVVVRRRETGFRREAVVNGEGGGDFETDVVIDGGRVFIQCFAVEVDS